MELTVGLFGVIVVAIISWYVGFNQGKDAQKQEHEEEKDTEEETFY
jgi:hypothetical protein